MTGRGLDHLWGVQRILSFQHEIDALFLGVWRGLDFYFTSLIIPLLSKILPCHPVVCRRRDHSGTAACTHRPLPPSASPDALLPSCWLFSRQVLLTRPALSRSRSGPSQKSTRWGPQKYVLRLDQTWTTFQRKFFLPGSLFMVHIPCLASGFDLWF